MKWTQKAPTKEGYYWFLWGPIPAAMPTIHYAETRDDQMQIDGVNLSWFLHRKPSGYVRFPLWAGPILVPVGAPTVADERGWWRQSLRDAQGKAN